MRIPHRNIGIAKMSEDRRFAPKTVETGKGKEKRKSRKQKRKIIAKAMRGEY